MFAGWLFFLKVLAKSFREFMFAGWLFFLKVLAKSFREFMFAGWLFFLKVYFYYDILYTPAFLNNFLNATAGSL